MDSVWSLLNQPGDKTHRASSLFFFLIFYFPKIFLDLGTFRASRQRQEQQGRASEQRQSLSSKKKKNKKIHPGLPSLPAPWDFSTSRAFLELSRGWKLLLWEWDQGSCVCSGRMRRAAPGGRNWESSPGPEDGSGGPGVMG